MSAFDLVFAQGADNCIFHIQTSLCLQDIGSAYCISFDMYILISQAEEVCLSLSVAFHHSRDNDDQRIILKLNQSIFREQKQGID